MIKLNTLNICSSNYIFTLNDKFKQYRPKFLNIKISNLCNFGSKHPMITVDTALESPNRELLSFDNYLSHSLN